MTQIPPSVIMGNFERLVNQGYSHFKLKLLKFDSTFPLMSPDQIIGFCLGLYIIQSSFIYFKFISLWCSRLQPRIYGLHWNRPTWISCKYTEKEPKVITWFDGRGKGAGSAEYPRSQVASPNFSIIIRIWDAHFPYTPHHHFSPK